MCLKYRRALVDAMHWKFALLLGFVLLEGVVVSAREDVDRKGPQEAGSLATAVFSVLATLVLCVMGLFLCLYCACFFEDDIASDTKQTQSK